MSRTSLISVILVAALPIVVTAVSAEDAELRNNPFARPNSVVNPNDAPVLQADGSASPLELHATLVSSVRRLANVGGHIVAPGETIDGYTLLRVYEDKAVFLRSGKQIVVHVKPDLVRKDEKRRR